MPWCVFFQHDRRLEHCRGFQGDSGFNRDESEELGERGQQAELLRLQSQRQSLLSRLRSTFITFFSCQKFSFLGFFFVYLFIRSTFLSKLLAKWILQIINSQLNTLQTYIFLSLFVNSEKNWCLSEREITLWCHSQGC